MLIPMITSKLKPYSMTLDQTLVRFAMSRAVTLKPRRAPGLGDPIMGQLRYRVPDNFWQGGHSPL